jgi:hypothetical protein
MVAAVVVVWIVLSILVGLTMAPLRRPSRMHPSSPHPGSLRSPAPRTIRR